MRGRYGVEPGEWSSAVVDVNPGKHPALMFDDDQFSVLLRKRYLLNLQYVDVIRGLMPNCGVKACNEEHVLTCFTGVTSTFQTGPRVKSKTCWDHQVYRGGSESCAWR